jgi:hypothetical protein
MLRADGRVGAVDIDVEEEKPLGVASVNGQVGERFIRSSYV